MCHLSPKVQSLDIQEEKEAQNLRMSHFYHSQNFVALNDVKRKEFQLEKMLLVPTVDNK